ncbi:HAD-IC family P-type ATPase, partial [Psychrobacter alimentarius]|uniref:HAD-IC family P-type ATPase n=1 Tax=Psychrobacter alimentarius TaxID=261164 RepID=UPI0019185B36
SPVTGESVPVAKTIDDDVFAGSINMEGVLQVRVKKTAANNTIARIIELVEQAQASKAPTARFIETFSRYYTPIVMVIAALVITLPPLLMGAEWATWLYRGLALLLIACPCALVLSTPAAIASGLAVGARHGMLIKGGHIMELVGQVSTVAFDKTGTLTEGKPRVTDVIGFKTGHGDAEGHDKLLSLFASVDATSSHPLAIAIVDHAKSANVVILESSNAFAT